MGLSREEIILSHVKGQIIEDVDIDNNIVQQLKKQSILDENDIKYIYTGSTKPDRAKLLIELVKKYVFYVCIFIFNFTCTRFYYVIAYTNL